MISGVFWLNRARRIPPKEIEVRQVANHQDPNRS